MAIRSIKAGIKHSHIYLNLVLIRTIHGRFCVKGCVTLIKTPEINLISEAWNMLAAFDTEGEGVEFMDNLAVSWSRLDIANV